MIEATFAVPGDLATPTGGYAYARHLLAEAGGAGVELTHLALPGGFPDPADDVLADTGRLLRALPAGRPIFIDGLALGVLPAKLLRALPGPVVALCHHPLALEGGVTAAEAQRLHKSERVALAECSHVIATSSTTAGTLIADYAVPETHVTVAHPGTDPAPRAAGSGGSRVAILSVGSLTRRKGHDVLISALAGLVDLDWRLTIAGPADREAEYGREVPRLIAEAGLQDRVELVGALDAEALAGAYAGADLFVLASRYEGFGMAYTEAMACGLPVIGCAAGAVPEATRGAAHLVRPGEVEALRGALGVLIGDRASRARLAEDCWQAAQGFVRWPDTAAVVAAVLRGVAA